jgi:hypothetical protein
MFELARELVETFTLVAGVDAFGSVGLEVVVMTPACAHFT